MIEFKQWIAMKATPLLIVLGATLVVLLSTAQATVVKDLRTGDNQGFVRLVLEFDRPLNPHPAFSVDGNSLKVTLAGIDNLPASPAAIDGITRLEVFRQSGGTRMEMDFAFVPANIKTFALTGPHRFIIDAYRPVPVNAAPLPVEETIHAQVREPNQAGPPTTSDKMVRAASPKHAEQDAPEPYSPPGAYGTGSDSESRNRFQQHLVAALIVVTSIILMLLFFLMRAGSAGSRSGQHAWIDQLPSTKDPDIEALDSAIRNHFKKYDRL